MTRQALRSALALFVTLAGTGLWGAESMPRIGVLMPSPANATLEDGFRQGLRELGYVEGKNILIDWRRSWGTEADVRADAAALVRSKVDVIVAPGTMAARAALNATKTIPVVFEVGDPLAVGLGASLAKPGANGTGVSILATELTSKRLEFLRQLLPRARRIAYLRNSANPIGPKMLEAAQKAARALSFELVSFDAPSSQGLEAALYALARSGCDGVMLSGELFFVANKTHIVETIRKARLPAIFAYPEYHEDGALASYGPSLTTAMRRVAVYVDKILKGAKPSDLPIEEMSQFELIIDLRIARELKLQVSETLLLRADEVRQ